MIGSATWWSRGLSALSWLSTLLLTACQGTPEAPARPPLAVQVEEARVARFADAVDTVSTLEAQGAVQLAAQASGRIQTLLVRQGEHFSHAQQLETTWQAHQAETEKLKNSLRARLAANDWPDHLPWVLLGLHAAP